VDSKTGRVIKSLSNIRGLYRRICDTTPLPWTGYCESQLDGTPYGYPGHIFGRREGAPPRGANPVYGGTDVDDLYDIVGQIHQLYYSKFGLNGANNLGGLGPGGGYPVTQTRGQTYKDVTWGSNCPGGASFDRGYINFCHGIVIPDVVGHEYSHGVVYFRPGGDLVYSGEPGALTESFADVMGEAFEEFATGTVDWINGGGPNDPSPRSLADPPSTSVFLQPYADKIYSPFYACGGLTDIYQNSTISSKAFYLMSEGGSFNGCSIGAVGIDKASQILFRAMRTYYTQSESFNAAYVHILQACADLYSGADCAEVEKALQAVELDQAGRCSGGVEIPPAADTRPVVAINGRDIRDTAARTAAATYRFRVCGKVTPVNQHTITVDDGSGPVTVLSTGFSGIASGDVATVTGNLDTSYPTPTLRVRPENVTLTSASGSPVIGLAVTPTPIARPTAPQAAKATVVLGPNPTVKRWHYSGPSLAEKRAWPQPRVQPSEQRAEPEIEPLFTPPTGPIIQVTPATSDCGCGK